METDSRVARLFGEMVAIDSPSGGEREMADVIRRRLELLGFQVREDSAGEAIGGNCGNLYAYSAGELPGEPLLFCTHMDTVEPAQGKQAVLHRDGTITSAGDTVLGADDLAGVAAILEALERIREEKLPRRDIELLFTISEETYCTGVELFDVDSLRSRQSYVLDLTGPVGTAAFKAPTALSLQFTIRGRAAHAGFAPEEGIHAIQAAAEAISSLKLGRVDEETVANIGVIRGGTSSNIVPDCCVVQGEVRSYDHDKAVAQSMVLQEAFAQAAEKLGAQVEFEESLACRAYETPLDHLVVQRFRRACAQEGLEPNFIPTFGGSDNNYLSTRGMAGLVLATAMNKCHSLEEYTSVEELERIAGLVTRLMTLEDPQ